MNSVEVILLWNVLAIVDMIVVGLVLRTIISLSISEYFDSKSKFLVDLTQRDKLGNHRVA